MKYNKITELHIIKLKTSNSNKEWRKLQIVSISMFLYYNLQSKHTLYKP